MHNEIVGEKGAERMKVLVFAEESIKQRVSERMTGEGVKVACSFINNFFHIPVVLLVRKNDAGWKRFKSSNPLGYVFEEASSAEMTGRLHALVQPQKELTGNYAGKGWRA